MFSTPIDILIFSISNLMNIAKTGINEIAKVRITPDNMVNTIWEAYLTRYTS